MIMEPHRLQEIAENLGLCQMAESISLLAQKIDDTNCPLVLPLVGEFSSGKTTLINSLTDSKQLETATKPTTATIYEVHFGADHCHANVVGCNGENESVHDISELKNEKLANAKVVEVFDTSTLVPSSIVLVDTPGLSSPDPQHKQTLIDFLPQADGILLVSDINQQITRSVTDFIRTMELSNRKIYLILTKCDTKATSELDKVKQYIADNIKLPMEQIICVSAMKGDISELSNLFASIQKDKANILKKVNDQRLTQISTTLLSEIDEILSATKSDQDIDKAIVEQEHRLKKISRNIDRLIEDLQNDIDVINRTTSRTFEDTILDRLDTLVAGKSTNFDAEAVSVINTTSSLLVNEFKEKIHEALQDKANHRRNTEDGVDLSSLESIDLSDLKVSGISYNLNLNSMGHEYDGIIASGVKIAGTVAAGAVAGYMVGAGAALDAADTVSDLACDGDAVVTKVASQATQNQQSGIVQSLVGLVTDSTMGKPQRRRAIRNYLDGSLVPTFKSEISRNKDCLIRMIKQNLNNEAQTTINAIKENLEHLKSEQYDAKEKFEKRVAELKSYKVELS